MPNQSSSNEYKTVKLLGAGKLVSRMGNESPSKLNAKDRSAEKILQTGQSDKCNDNYRIVLTSHA